MQESADYINVRFENIDKIVDGNCIKEYFDESWAVLSNSCCSEYYTKLTEYKEALCRFNASKRKRKQPGDNTDGVEDENGNDEDPENEEPIFNPPVIYSYPSSIDFENSDVAELMTLLAVRSNSRNMTDVVRQLKRHKGSVEMCGFPKTDILLGINQSMLLPGGSFYVSFRDWLVQNKGFELPGDITRQILMAIYQRKTMITPSISTKMDEIGLLPKNILTTSDLRSMLHLSDVSKLGTMLSNRSNYIYQQCKKSFLSSDNGTQRVADFMNYLKSTAIPLASATAKSDNGENGGSDPRVDVFNTIGEYTAEGSSTSHMYVIFEETIKNVLDAYKPNPKWCLDSYEDSLLYTLFLYNTTLVYANQDYNLKGNNIELITKIFISDAGLSLNYNASAIGMAKNGIGHTLHVKNFNGCLFELSVNGTEEANNSKIHGVGADNTMNKYIEAQNPKNNQVPAEVEISRYPTIDSLIGTTPLGFWYTYSEIIVTSSLKKLNSITSVPPLVYCTELPVSNKACTDSNESMYPKIAPLMARQTETESGAKRSFTTKNEITQTSEPATQEQICYIKILMFCHNEKAREDKEKTVKKVVTDIPAAAVDIDDVSFNDDDTQIAEADMGDAGKFVGTKNNPIVTRTHPFLFSVQGLAQVVISIQRIGLVDSVKDGFEGSILSVLSNIVYMNKCWMTLEAACPSSRGRQNEKVQSRLPAMSVLMHATRTFLHPQISVMNWTDIVSMTCINWCSNPCPSALFPVFISELLSNTMDWSTWLILMVFVDYFKVPEIDMDVMESLFSSDFSALHALPASKTENVLKWLESVGLNRNGDSDEYDILYQPESEPLLSRSTVYVTEKWDADDNSVKSPLTVNVERSASSNNTKEGKTSNFRHTIKWKIAEAVGTAMYDIYKTKLLSSCNIADVDIFITMIYRNMNRLLHFPKYGAVPCGAGFQSLNNMLKGLGSNISSAAVYGKLNSDNYVDGSDASVRKHLRQSKKSYEIAPIKFVNREGSVWSMGVEVRFLILVKGLIGIRPAISQMSVQSILDNLTSWVVKGRMPATIFCENKFITTHPDNLGTGLNIIDISHSDIVRPNTMIRPSPNQAVEENSANLLPGALLVSVVPVFVFSS